MQGYTAEIGHEHAVVDAVGVEITGSSESRTRRFATGSPCQFASALNATRALNWTMLSGGLPVAPTRD